MMSKGRNSFHRHKQNTINSGGNRHSIYYVKQRSGELEPEVRYIERLLPEKSPKYIFTRLLESVLKLVPLVFFPLYNRNQPSRRHIAIIKLNFISKQSKLWYLHRGTKCLIEIIFFLSQDLFTNVHNARCSFVMSFSYVI